MQSLVGLTGLFWRGYGRSNLQIHAALRISERGFSI